MMQAPALQPSHAHFWASDLVGAYFSALKGFKNIPLPWVKKTLPAKNILKYI